nr:reverse transcriptase domain-containing protein [Tanacetum cinerariifolium]
MLPVTQIDTFNNGLTLRHRDTINAAADGTFMKRRPKKCYDLIENMTAHHNDWDTSAQRSVLASLFSEAGVIHVNWISFEHCIECRGTVDQTQNVYAAGAYNQGGNSYQPQGNRTLLSYRSDNYLGPPGFNQNQNRSNPNQNYQNRNQGNNNENPQGNNPGRNQFFQGASHVQNPPPAYQAPSYQSPGYQAPVQQALIPQPQVVTTTEFTNYMKENDNMFGQFMKMNTTSSSGSKTLPSNTITNPKEDLKGITTRSGIAYKGPTIPTTSSPPKVAEHETKVTKDTVPPTNNGSTKDVQPLVVHVETQVPNSGPVVAPVVEPVEAPPGRALIDVYEGELTLRVGNKAVTFNLYQTSRYFANYDAELINQIDVIDVACKEYSQEVLGFSVSGNPTPSTEPIVSTSSPTLTLFGDSDFLREETDAFLAIEDEPISSKTDDSYYDSNRDILLLKEFLNDDPHHHLSLQKNLKSLNLKMKNILLMNHPWLNLRTYHLILNMHFWRVYDGYFSRYDQKMMEVFMDDFSVFGNSFETCLSYLDKMLKRCEDTNLCLNMEKSYFMVKEGIVLGHKISKNGIKVEKAKVDVIAKLPHPTTVKVFMDDFSVFGNSFETCLSYLDKMLKRCEDTNLCLNVEKSYFMVKEGIVLGHKISKNGIKVEKAKVDVIAKLPHPTTVK